MKPTFQVVTDVELTGRYVITFHKDATADGLGLLREKGGLSDLVRASDFAERAVNVEQAMARDGAVLDELDVCVVNCAKQVAERLETLAPRSAIIAVEPEHYVCILGENAVTVPPDDGYHQGDAASHVSTAAADHYLDTANESWGIRATGVERSPYSGEGVRVAVLDSGIDLNHPDLQRSNIVARESFQDDGDVHDENGHGTHCAGIVCGPRRPNTIARYGVVPDAEILIGKVVDKEGLGSERAVLAGLNWAIAKRCDVVSLSIGANTKLPSQAFEHVGQRALNVGTLIMAAAGNNSNRGDDVYGPVIRPGNNRSIMAVGAVDRQLQVADFSARSSKVTGGEVDIVAPGIEVLSAWPLPVKFRALNGTSMATPFVAGVAALHADALGLRGLELWNRLMETARSLPAGAIDVGAGLVQAP